MGRVLKRFNIDNKITLEPIVDLSNIDALHTACKAALSCTDTAIHIDASHVERLKTPVFQLLIAFHNAIKTSNKKLIIDPYSEGFENLAKCLGVWEILKTE